LTVVGSSTKDLKPESFIAVSRIDALIPAFLF